MRREKENGFLITSAGSSPSHLTGNSEFRHRLISLNVDDLIHLSHLPRRSIFAFAPPASHDAQSPVLRHGADISPARIPDPTDDCPARLAVRGLKELARETLVRAKTERGSRRVINVDAVACKGCRPGAAAGPMRTSAVVCADELDLETLWGAEGKEGEHKEREEDDGIHC